MPKIVRLYLRLPKDPGKTGSRRDLTVCIEMDLTTGPIRNYAKLTSEFI